MILAYAIILLIILALLLRRDLSPIGQLPYRGGWKLAVIIGVLFLLQRTLVFFGSEQTVLHMLLLILSHLAITLLFIVNHHLPGAKIFALGIVLNTTVMVANGGWMPVTPETYQFVRPNQTVELQSKPTESKNLILPRAETKLWILSDIIRVALPWRRSALSIGDILLIVGVAQFLFQTTSKDVKQEPNWVPS